MRNALIVAAIFVMALPSIPSARAQQSAQTAAAPAEHHYKLHLVVEQVDETGKVINSRSFVASVLSNTTRPDFPPGPGGARQSIRTGERIPVATSSTDYTYLDIGVDFDVYSPKQNGENFSFWLTANVSSLADGASQNGASSSHPIIRQNRWDSAVVIPLDKPTVVFSADDLQGKGKMQVEVTATKLD